MKDHQRSLREAPLLTGPGGRPSLSRERLKHSPPRNSWPSRTSLSPTCSRSGRSVNSWTATPRPAPP